MMRIWTRDELVLARRRCTSSAEVRTLLAHTYEYNITYDEPDEQGYWGRRLNAEYITSSKDALDAVERFFLLRHPRAKIYRTTVD